MVKETIHIFVIGTCSQFQKLSPSKEDSWVQTFHRCNQFFIIKTKFEGNSTVIVFNVLFNFQIKFKSATLIFFFNYSYQNQ